MKQELNEIEINGVKYARVIEDKVVTLPKKDTEKYIIRCAAAGVFFGELISLDLEKGIAEIKNSRRLWYWAGAASLSQLAVDGTSSPKDCKFPVEVPLQKVNGIIEVILCTPKAITSIEGVPVWKA